MFKINIITLNNQYGLTQDALLLVSILKDKFKKNVLIKYVNFFDFQCDYADINIFIETVSNILFKYAKINILIPNQEWYYKTWIPYLDNFDYILTKTNYGSDLFRNLTKKNIKYIGWESRDLYNSKYIKNYDKAIHICGKSKYKQTQLLIDNWNENMPLLHVIYNSKHISLKKNNIQNIKYIENRIPDNELIELMNTCGIHICTSETEGFGHYINEAKSCESITFTTNSKPMNELITNDMGFLINIKKKEKLKYTVGCKNIIDFEDLRKKLSIIKTYDNNLLKQLGSNARKSFKSMNACFRIELTSFFSDLINKIQNNNLIQSYIDIEKILNNNSLPSISIITPTANRRSFFKLAIYNFKNIDYPIDKIEWIIVDDGIDSIRDMLPDDNRIKYYFLPDKLKIGEKRNYCINQSTNDIIIFMDDDDYYPSESVKKRVSYLINSGKDCVVCSTIGCFDINKYASIINVPPHQLAFHHRISEATLCFKKEFWLERGFKNESVGGEASEFLENRVNKCLEISWKNIIVSLLHSKNTSTRIARMKEPNGCHFDFSDQLFLFLTSLDNINESTSKEDNINSSFSSLEI